MSDIIYGINSAREGLQSLRRRPLELLLAQGLKSPRIDELAALAQKAGVPVKLRDRRELDRLAGLEHHQGVVLKVEPFDFADLETLIGLWRSSAEPAFFLFLDGITDPHNLGAILRSAEAAGCQGVIVPKDRSCPVTAVVDKSSAGALSHIRLCQVTNLSRAIEQIKELGVWVYGLSGEEGAVSLYRTDFRGHVALVVGAEGSGMRPNIKRHCDGLVSIPMAGAVSSLNASVAAGISLFEVVRQRKSV